MGTTKDQSHSFWKIFAAVVAAIGTILSATYIGFKVGKTNEVQYSSSNKYEKSTASNNDDKVIQEAKGDEIIQIVGKENIVNQYDRDKEKKNDIQIALKLGYAECMRKAENLKTISPERLGGMMLTGIGEYIPVSDFIEVRGKERYQEINNFFINVLLTELQALQLEAINFKMATTESTMTTERADIHKKLRKSAIGDNNAAKIVSKVSSPDSGFDPNLTQGIEDPMERLKIRRDVFVNKMKVFCEMMNTSL